MRRCALCGTSLDGERQTPATSVPSSKIQIAIRPVPFPHPASRADQQGKRARRLIADVTERMRLAVRVGALPDAAPRAPEASALLLARWARRRIPRSLAMRSTSWRSARLTSCLFSNRLIRISSVLDSSMPPGLQTEQFGM
jgi:hypothetical protein